MLAAYIGCLLALLTIPLAKRAISAFRKRRLRADRFTPMGFYR